jgi:GxxExxY protein
VEERDALSERVIGCAIEVHRSLGPGLLETAYEQCLAHELSLNAIEFRMQVPMPIAYKSIRLDCGFRMDLVVEDELLIELKSVEKVLPIHESQLLTYLKLSGLRTGLLINFNERRLVDGIRRYKN